MVAHLLRLRRHLLANSLRRSPLGMAGVVLGVVYGLALAALAVFGVIVVSRDDATTAGAIVVLGGSALVLATFLLPVFVGGHDQFDPRRFTLFGVEAVPLARGLVIASLVSVPGLVFAGIALAQLWLFPTDVASAVASVVSVPLIISTLLLAARLGMSAGAWMHERPGARGILRVLVAVALVLLVPGLLQLTSIEWTSDGVAALRETGAVFAWTPLGAAWAIAPAAAQGAVPTVIGTVALALVTVALLWWCWTAVVGRLLLSTARPEPRRDTEERVAAGLLVHGPVGAIAARSFTNWLRDPRYLTSTIIVPVVPLLMALPLLIAGVPSEIVALIPVPVVALFLGWSTHNDLAFDHTAIWLHVASHTRGVHDRLGRTVPALVIGVPVVAITALVCAAVHGDPLVLAPMLGVGFGILGIGLGVSAVVSARFPYPTVLPGDSPFSQPATGNGGTVQAGTFLLILVLSSPIVALGAASVVLGEAFPWITLAAGLLLGFLVLGAGLRWGGRVFDRRAPEILAAAMRS